MWLPIFLVVLPWWTVAEGRPQSLTNLTRIVGGSSVEISKVPYQAAIILDGTNACSGAILKESYVLTAANCVSGYSKRSIKVRVGTTSLNSGGTSAKVCKVISHPSYTSWRFDNNLAILKLCEPLKVSSSIKPIQITDKVPEDDTQMQVTGWGSTCWWASWLNRCFGSRPSRLRIGTTFVYDQETCASDLGVWFGLWDNGISDLTLCTWDSGVGACTYDTGAPLVKDNKLVGILSEGGCSNEADVYANVLEFKSWLADNTKDDSTTTESSTETSSSTTGGSSSSTISSSSSTISSSSSSSSSSTSSGSSSSTSSSSSSSPSSSTSSSSSSSTDSSSTSTSSSPTSSTGSSSSSSTDSSTSTSETSSTPTTYTTPANTITSTTPTTPTPTETQTTKADGTTAQGF